jgi:DNA-binding Lrp family transcriptional regulator
MCNEMGEKLDKYDKKIITSLDIDARKSASSIAKEIGLPKETVNYRIQRLVSQGTIRRFYTIINAARFGYQYYRVYIRYQSIRSQTENNILSYLYSSKYCSNIRLTEGQYDMVFLAIVSDAEELSRFLYEFMEQFGAVIREKSIHTLITSYKLNQKFVYPMDSVKTFFSHSAKDPVSLDEKDQQILRLISTKARMRLVDIARETGIHSKLVSYHLKKMKADGVIVQYAVDLDVDRFQKEYLQLDITLRTPSVISSIIEFFDKTHTCLFVYNLVGKFDLSLELYVQNDDQLRLIMSKFRDTFQNRYIDYTINHIYKELDTGWSPYTP